MYDELLRRSARPPATGRVSVVAVDEKSLAEIGQWPWRRDVVARLVERVRDLGAAVIAFDIIFSERDRLGSNLPRTGTASVLAATTTDATLAEVFERGRVVMSYAFTFDAPTPHAGTCVLHPLPAARVSGPGEVSPAERLFHARGVVCSLSALNQAAGASGFLNVSADADGILRRIPLLIEYRGDLYPSLGLAAVQRLRSKRSLTVTAARNHPLILGLDEQAIPLDRRGALLLRFRGRGGTIRHVGASDVLEGRLPAGAFTDQIVFVGGTALGVTDVVTTPLATSYPGVEVHATVAENLLGRNFIGRPAFAEAYELGAALAAALAVAVFTIAGGLFWGSLHTGIGVVCVWALASWALGTSHTFFSPLFPTLSAAMSLASLTVAEIAHAQRRAEMEKDRRQQAYRFIVQSLTSLTETRDPRTGEHARRTQAYTRLVAGLLAKSSRYRATLTPETVELMAILAPVHDIGKVGMPDTILHKNGPLTPDEWVQIRSHPRLGYDAIDKAETQSLIKDEQILKLAKEIVYTHHEWWTAMGIRKASQASRSLSQVASWLWWTCTMRWSFRAPTMTPSRTRKLSTASALKAGRTSIPMSSLRSSPLNTTSRRCRRPLAPEA